MIPEVNKMTVNELPDGRLTMRDAAKYIGITYSYLKDYHKKSTMPPSVKVGRLVFFYRSDLDKWINSGASDCFKKT